MLYIFQERINLYLFTMYIWYVFVQNTPYKQWLYNIGRYQPFQRRVSYLSNQFYREELFEDSPIFLESDLQFNVSTSSKNTLKSSCFILLVLRSLLIQLKHLGKGSQSTSIYLQIVNTLSKVIMAKL